MKCYVIYEEHSQPRFTDRYGDEAKPYTRIAGVRATRPEAESFKKRLLFSLREMEGFGQDDEDVNVYISEQDMPMPTVTFNSRT